MKHKHYEMIVVKAANMDLVVFIKAREGWRKMSDQSEIRIKSTMDYFLCLPQHKEACLHWLGGGNIQYRIALDAWTDAAGNVSNAAWTPDNLFIDDQVEFRIKPKKEKRWICITDNLEIEDGTLYESLEDANENSPGYKQIIEIEVEVKL